MESGVRKKIPSIDKQSIRDKYNLKKDYVISFVGRHNEVKGYDLLVKFTKKLFEKSSDIKILVCGEKNKIIEENSNRWIEIGWTNSPESYINASNVFVLPNRETYFDLVFLEALSLKKIIVASYTGGNKYFERFKNSGIFLYKNENEFYEIIDKLKNSDINKIKELENMNYKIYENIFNQKQFMKRYENTLTGILE